LTCRLDEAAFSECLAVRGLQRCRVAGGHRDRAPVGGSSAATLVSPPYRLPAMIAGGAACQVASVAIVVRGPSSRVISSC
jgi:hypothetical protein